MCQIFAGQDPDTYASETRSIRLNGYSTSIRLEAAFWARLERLAADQGMTVPQFVSKLHDEVLELRGEVGNFTSLLRCACLIDASHTETAIAAE
ncbi:ribbon-helix-helix domain-containing protein [Rhodobacteraceae bacterium NNCM2]|nr:ribbon-helix-helix domain-containing protein [Coraliihabitans acroporae]